MTNLFDLTGKHALVTGASSGLGRHFAGTLAAAGAKVSVAARRQDARQLVGKCRPGNLMGESVDSTPGEIVVPRMEGLHRAAQTVADTASNTQAAARKSDVRSRKAKATGSSCISPRPASSHTRPSQ